MVARAFFAVASAAVVYAAIWLDAPSVAWARALPPAWADFFGFITRYGRSDWMLIPTGLFILVLLAADWSRVDRRLAAAWAEIGILVYFFFIAVAGAGLANNLVKWLVGRSRPVLFDTDGPFAFAPFSAGYAHVSFPSGHATNITAAATVIALVAPRAAVPVIAAAILIGLSRVAVGAHYPSDVFAGALLGSAVAVTLAYVFADARCGFRPRLDGGVRREATALAVVVKRRGLRALFGGLGEALLPGRRPGAPAP